MEGNSGEVPNLTTWPLYCVRMGILEAFRYLELLQQSTAMERFNGGRRQPPDAERKLFQWRVRALGLFQYQDGALG